MKSNLRIMWAMLLSVLLAVSLTACGGGGGGSSSGTTTTSIPSAPTGVTASAGEWQVTISWSAVSGATSYNIYWSTTPGVTKTSGTKITGATSPYNHTGRTTGTTYYYIVTAVNSSGESVKSAQVSTTPTAPNNHNNHTGRTNGTTYYYIVTAVNSSGESVKSAQVSTTPTAPTDGSL